jgi:predicted aspartyl protease
MISGAVNAYHEATIRLPVQATGGQRREIETILDTGFNGSLTLPPDLIADLGLPWRTRGLISACQRRPRTVRHLRGNDHLGWETSPYPG